MQNIINEIWSYIAKSGGQKHQWYVGIASDPRDCLFSRHAVKEQSDLWVFKDAGSEATARAVEKAFIDDGYSGGPGGGDWTTRFVYAYMIAPHTRE